MKNKKILFLIVLLVIGGLLITIIGFDVNNSFKKLKGDVSDTNPELSFVCSKTSLDLNESTSCTLKLNTGNYSVSTFQGLLTSSSNLTISNIRMSEGWHSEETNSNKLIYYRTGSFSPGEVTIATFNVTGTSSSQGYIKIGKLNNELILGYNDGDLVNAVNLTEKTMNISVGDSTDTSVSHDASLKELYINNEDVLESSTYNVDSDIDSVTIIATANNSKATITGDGIVQLNYGNNSIKITVTAEDGTTTTEKNLTIVRTSSEELQEDFLTSLSITPGELDKTFDSNTFLYSAEVSSSVERITVSATSGETTSTITGTGERDLIVGENYINVEVTSADEITNEYVIVVTRRESSDEEDPDEPTEKSSDASVQYITVDGMNVDLDTLSLTVDYLNNDIVEIIVTPKDPQAVAKGEVGNRQLQVGENKYNIFVEAEDGTRNIFDLTIIRKNQEESGSDSDDNICQLSSDRYIIDNVSLIVSNVSIDDSLDTIKENINTTCGTITVTNDKVVLENGTSVKKYKIERYWAPKTGNDVIKYWLLFGIVIILTIGGIVIKLYLNKKQK